MPEKHGNVLSWASDIEPDTIEQAQMTARMPFVEGHVALMPDAHRGLGSTVGSVIPTRGAIIPAAIGVDIGCVDAESEVLTRRGWKPIGEFIDSAQHIASEILQFNPLTETSSWTRATGVVKRPSKGFYKIKTKYGVNQMLSSDHKVLSYKTVGRNRRREQRILTASELVEDHNSKVLGSQHGFLTTFGSFPSYKGINLSDYEIRLQVAINADATIAKGKAVFKLKKERKIQRLRWLLFYIFGKDGFTESTDQEGCTIFRCDTLNGMEPKSYNRFWFASNEQLETITEECLLWDGNVKDRCFYTGDKEFADFIQFAFTACGYRAVLREDPPRGHGNKPEYRVFAHDNNYVGIRGVPKTPIEFVEPQAGEYDYCLTVPAGFFVMRRGGNIVITGNCGMVAAETDMTAEDLPDDITPLLSRIEEAIPAGVGRGHDDYKNVPTESVFSKNMPKELSTNGKLLQRAMKQMGSLGSGNHFFELCLDERDHVWLVLHSGSRGVGNELAKAHIEGARGIMKKYFVELEDRDLAYLVEGTDEFNAYIEAMLWAQNYAMENRSVMMASAIEEFILFMGGRGNVVQTINCHHNFTEMENHNGRNVWLTRKGAIRAREGDLGVIPGSMGTRSYIVEGLGNPSSYMSCSHGAGRRMSRTKAKKEFDVTSFKKAMEGKVWLEASAEKLLDEHPGSYKDIDAVMADQKDLVKIRHTLRQILNFKGVQ